jgi:hypothetical protein
MQTSTFADVVFWTAFPDLTTLQVPRLAVQHSFLFVAVLAPALATR